MSRKLGKDRVLQCKVNEECSNMSFSNVKSLQSHQRTHKANDKSGSKPVAAKPLKNKSIAANSAKELLNSFSSINVKVSTEPQNGNEPRKADDIKNQKSVSTKVVVSKQPPQKQKRPSDGSDSVPFLKPKQKSRKTNPQKKDKAVLVVKTDSRQPGCFAPAPALRKFSVPCHCPECLPCMEECCDNPAVRSGRCCDPETLGQCLQPLQPQCYAPCCVPGHVRLREDLDFVNGNVVNKKDVLKQRESEKMRVRRLLLSNISEEVHDTVSTYFEAADTAEDHEMMEVDSVEEDVDVYTWEDEDWDEVLAAENKSDDDFYTHDTLELEETDLVSKPPDLFSYTRFYKSSSLPPGARVVHDVNNGNLEVWYKSAEGTRFNSKAHLKAAQFSMKKKHADPIKFVLTSNNINNNNSQQNLVAIANKDPKSLQIPSSSYFDECSVSKEGEALTPKKNDEKGEKTFADSYQSLALPNPTLFPILTKKCKDEVVEKCPSAGSNKMNSSTTAKVLKYDSPKSGKILRKDECPPSKEVKPSASTTNQRPSVDRESSFNKLPNEESVARQARCQPCDTEFPVKDITNHLMSFHNHEKTKLKSCTKCPDVVLMTVYHLRKHRELVHPESRGEKGRPRKNPNLASTPKPASQRKDEPVEPFNLFDSFTVPDEFNRSDDLEASLNSSAENIDKIEDFLNKTAPAQVNQSMLEPGEVIPKKKRGRPSLAEADKKKRSRSLGGVKAKPSPKKRKSQGKKLKVTPVKPVIDDNDPRHATSSVNLRQNRVHSHDSSQECSMNCSLTPQKFGSMPLLKEYKVDSIEDSHKVSNNKSGAKVAAGNNNKVLSLHAKRQLHK